MGWTCKDGARVLGVVPTRWSHAAGPAFAKIAKLMLADPRRTMADLQAAMDQLDESEQRATGRGSIRPTERE